MSKTERAKMVDNIPLDCTQKRTKVKSRAEYGLTKLPAKLMVNPV